MIKGGSAKIGDLRKFCHIKICTCIEYKINFFDDAYDKNGLYVNAEKNGTEFMYVCNVAF